MFSAYNSLEIVGSFCVGEEIIVLAAGILTPFFGPAFTM